jgi:hypothetical protein
MRIIQLAHEPSFVSGPRTRNKGFHKKNSCNHIQPPKEVPEP